jgi:single-stranded-DNA-specific exonuclease
MVKKNMGNLSGQQSQTSLPPVIQKLFEKRNYSQEDIKNFFSWDLKELPEITKMNGMEEGSLRIIEALLGSEHIAIYGDYDVDGTTSCALFYHFFKMLPEFESQITLIQPSRFVEGYGLHLSSIDNAKEKGVDLLITVDCGITNNAAADYAKEQGIDIIITDHHKDASDTMVDAVAVINPNRRDEPEHSPLRPLAGVGVAFAVCWEIKKKLEEQDITCPSLYPLLQFVAIGTICDLAKLTPMNLKLVRHGLKQLPTSLYPGVKVFLSPEERKVAQTPSEKLSFNIGPMINSKGRLDHPEMALNLLISDDSDKAFECYSHLEISNKERKVIQFDVYESAKEQYQKSIHGEEPVVAIVYDESWHEGVIGIVASKLVEAYKVPAIVFTNSEEEGVIKASARSAGELNMFDCLKECSDLFNKFGGHKAAAGLSMPVENYAAFKTKMTNMLQEIPVIERTVQHSFDLDINFEEVDARLVKELERLEPFGMGNQKPIFRMKNFKLGSFDILKALHVRWNLEKDGKYLKGISFNMIGKYGHLHPEDLFTASKEGKNLSAYFTLGINRFNGNEYIQLMVERISIDEF